MKVCIVTTYPERGSQNIGDQLITLRSVEYIRAIMPQNVEIFYVWRADDWVKVSPIIQKVDLIVFACLALREHMTKVEYPYLWDVINSNIPYCVLAAGTALDPEHASEDLYPISADSLKALSRMNDEALLFTTRGVLTQSYCRSLGLDRALFSGDIAFYDSRYFESQFKETREVKKIAISDPHGGMLYWKPLIHLIESLPSIFPDAEIVVYIHGRNDQLSKRLGLLGHRCVELYKDKNMGLDQYDSIDLHVGFRVHGHVSALTRRKPSYLLEQDGRGCDYGLTFDANISVPCYVPKPGSYVGYFVSRVLRKLKIRKNVEGPGKYPAEKILAIIRKDHSGNFSNFKMLDAQFESFIRVYRDKSSVISNYFKI